MPHPEKVGVYNQASFLLQDTPSCSSSLCESPLRMHVWLLFLCLVPIVSGLVPLPAGASPNAPSLIISSLATSTPTASPAPNASNCGDVSSEMSASCWDALGMAEWMSTWNKTTKSCNSTEIWSSCFLRLAFEEKGYDCSMLGSLYCEAPELGQTPKEAHAFYGAYNIWGMQAS